MPLQLLAILPLDLIVNLTSVTVDVFRLNGDFDISSSFLHNLVLIDLVNVQCDLNRDMRFFDEVPPIHEVFHSGSSRRIGKNNINSGGPFSPKARHGTFFVISVLGDL